MENKKGSLADIDEMEEIYKPDQNKKDFSIIYFVIVCHGIIRYDADDDDENVVTPEFIKTVPANIEYFNKITYTPIGFPNVMPIDKMVDGIKHNNFYIFQQIRDLLNHEYLVNYELIEALPGVDQLTATRIEIDKQAKDRPEVKLRGNSEIIQKIKTAQNTPAYSKLLGIREKDLYGSRVYIRDNNDYNSEYMFMNKEFLMDSDKKDWNIYVAFERHGKNQKTYLEVGEPILTSNHYKDFLIKTIPTEFDGKIVGFSKETMEEILNEETRKITTSRLLDLAAFYNYKNVVMIDYSCSVVRDKANGKISRDIIMKHRDELGYFAGSKNKNKNKNKKKKTMKKKTMKKKTMKRTKRK
jgi:hypothetical protein